MVSYPDLVSTHQDVILDCLDDPDISIRLQALELAARMVRSHSLQAVVTRLIDQLVDTRRMIGDGHLEIGPTEGLGTDGQKSQRTSLSLPLDYRVEVLHQILDICSHNNYAELSDFEWYVEILVQLVGLIPPLNHGCPLERETYQRAVNDTGEGVACRIGSEMRNVAVRVRDVRADATQAAESLLLAGNREVIPNGLSGAVDGVLGPFVWIVGEFAKYLSSPGQTLLSLIDLATTLLPPRSLCLIVQALPKLLVSTIRANPGSWDARQQGEISLLLARILVFLEPLAAHPDLDVQERAIEFLEVMRLAADVTQSDCYRPDEIPFLLSSMIPSLFEGLELNPVAANAQKKVPLPEHLMIDRPLNDSLHAIFDCRRDHGFELGIQSAFQDFYMNESAMPNRQPDEINLFSGQFGASYQDPGSLVGEPVNGARRKVERREGNFDDPFYIGTDDNSETYTPFDQTLATSGGADLDIDAIPIVNLKLNERENPGTDFIPRKDRRMPKPEIKRYSIVSDETIGQDDVLPAGISDGASKAKRSVLQVDSSGLGRLPFSKEGGHTDYPPPSGTSGHDAEMSMAMQRVERLRLEMQRASERVHTDDFPVEGTLIKKKKKAKKSISSKLAGTDEFPAGVDANGMHPPYVKKKAKSRSKSGQPSS